MKDVLPTLVHCLGITTQADPGALARVIEPFTKLGLIPLSVQTRLYQESEELAVDIQIAGLSDEQCRRIASQIETMPFSIRVVTCRKHFV